jgi:protein-S-isoprenylcysteine O-methyltransferase Ste14
VLHGANITSLMATPVPSFARAHPIRGQKPEASARHLVGNILVSLTCFSAALPVARHFEYGPASLILMIGALIMGIISLVRFPPRTAMMNSKAFVSTLVVLLLSALVRPAPASVGVVASIAILMEVCGLLLSEVARIYMGRSFGILPGNRGIVTKGPFRIVRHPVYAGWFLLAIGYFLAYPSWINVLIVSVASPFMLWRILLEEQLLFDDPEYREYVERVRFRLIPGAI